MGYIRVPFVLSVLAVVSACGTVDQRIDPDAPDPVGGAVLQSQDFRTMADRMAREIMSRRPFSEATAEQPLTFHITQLRNDTSDTFDTELALYDLRTTLLDSMEDRVLVLDRSKQSLEEIRAERAAKRAGAVAANPEMEGSLLGSDYVLKGVVKERVQQSRDLKSAYYAVFFELTDLESGVLRWSGRYETKFVSEKSVISR